LATTAVGTGDDLEEVAVGILEVHAAATVVVVDLAGLCLARVGPVFQPPLTDAPEDVVEVVLADQEGVMLGGDLAVDL
jgi:hypothetical protein